MCVCVCWTQEAVKHYAKLIPTYIQWSQSRAQCHLPSLEKLSINLLAVLQSLSLVLMTHIWSKWLSNKYQGHCVFANQIKKRNEKLIFNLCSGHCRCVFTITKCEVFFFFFSDMVFKSIAHYSSMLESLLPFPSHVEHLLFFCFLLLNPFKVLGWVLETPLRTGYTLDSLSIHQRATQKT